jgi:hypothetical protein
MQHFDTLLPRFWLFDNRKNFFSKLADLRVSLLAKQCVINELAVRRTRPDTHRTPGGQAADTKIEYPFELYLF